MSVMAPPRERSPEDLGDLGERQNADASSSAAQTSQAAGNRGVRAPSQPPSDGTDPATSRELPSDDARSMYDPPAPRPRKRSRARRSIARSLPPAPKPHTPTPDERERVAEQIADAREIAAAAAERNRP